MRLNVLPKLTTSNMESLGRDFKKRTSVCLVVSIFYPYMEPLRSTMNTKKCFSLRAGGSSYGSGLSSKTVSRATASVAGKKLGANDIISATSSGWLFDFCAVKSGSSVVLVR